MSDSDDGSSARELRAIFFDIDDTLFSTSDFASEARRVAVERMRAMGFNVPTVEALVELGEVIAEFGSNYNRHFNQLLARCGTERRSGVNPALLEAAAVVGYHETKERLLRPFEDVVEVLGQLARSGPLLGVITSGLAIKQAEKLVRLNIAKLFDPRAVFITDQMGISKPNPKLYQRAAAGLGLEPRACMYVGDHPVLDIDAAGAVGFITVRVRRGGRHDRETGVTKPDYEVQNFWDLSDLLARDFNIKP